MMSRALPWGGGNGVYIGVSGAGIILRFEVSRGAGCTLRFGCDNFTAQVGWGVLQTSLPLLESRRVERLRGSYDQFLSILISFDAAFHATF